jgi:hypothetical protein
MLGSMSQEAIHFVHCIEGGGGLEGREVTYGSEHESIEIEGRWKGAC